MLMGALVVASTSMVTSCKDYDDDINANTTEINNLKSQIATLESALSTCRTECATNLANAKNELQSKIDALETELGNAKAGLQAAVDANASNIADLQGKVTALEAELAQAKDDLVAEVAARTAEINRLDEVIAAIQQNYATAEELAAAKQEAAVALAAYQASNDARVAEVEGQVRDLNGNLAEVSDLVRDNLGRIVTAEGAIVSLNESVAAINGQLGTINEALKALEDADDAILVKIDENYNALVTANELLAEQLATQEAALALYIDAAEAADEATNERIDELTATVVALKEQLQNATDAWAGNITDAVSKYLSEHNIVDNSGAVAQNAADIADLKQAYADAKEMADEEVAKLNAAIAANKELINTVDGKLTTVDTKLSTLTGTVTTLSGKIGDVNDRIDALTVLVNKQLTSLVLKPGYYFGGIEAIEVPTLQNYKTYTGKELLTINEVFTQNGTAVNVSEGGVAVYHVNPATADLAGYALDFYGNDPITRAGIQFVNSKAANYEELAAKGGSFKAGLINVPFTVNYAAVKKTIGEGKTPMIAFQMTKTVSGEKRVVTSDYAMLNVTDYKDLLLADNSFKDHNQATAADLKQTHLFGQGDDQKVLDLKPTTVVGSHDIAADESLDLKTIVRTHYSYDAADESLSVVDKEMTKATFDALGLSYQFDLIAYKVDGRTKGENEYVTLEDGVVTPIATAYPQGHQPIVRVQLLNGTNVLKVAYIKLNITGTTTPEYTFTYEGQKAVDCEKGVSFNSIVKAEVDKKFYEDARIALDKDAFASAYAVVGSVDQFTKTVAENGDVTYAKATKPVGTVTIADGKFVWTLTYAEATDASWKFNENGVSTVAKTTYVKYTAGDDKNAYAAIVIPAGAIQIPAYTMSSDNKVAARWYKENLMDQNADNAELTEIHVNPEVVGQAGADDEIYYDILNSFVNREVIFNAKNSTFKSSDIKDYRFVFVMPSKTWTVYGKSGKAYKMSISEDGTKLFAGEENIATLSGEHNSVVTYNTKAVAEDLAAYDILNKNASTELAEGETFKAYIGVQAKVCDWAQYGLITARFLRPVNLNTTSYEADKDAIDGGFYADLMNLFETPKDWRLQWVGTGANNYWDYYGITEIAADVENAYTDAAKGVNERTALKPGFDDEAAIKALNTVKAANVEFSYVAPDSKHKYGQVLYTNNNATITNIHIYVPITITYDWGYKVNMGYARIDVAPTVNNAK